MTTDQNTEPTELLIYFDKEKYEKQVRFFEDKIPFFKENISKYDSLGIGRPFQKEDFEKLFLIPEEFLFERLMEDKPLSVGGMAVNKQKLFELLDKPAGYHLLSRKINEVLEKQLWFGSSQLPNYSRERFLEFYEVHEDGNINLKEEEKEKIKSSNETYVSKEKSKETYNFFSDLCKLLNDSKFVANEMAQPDPRFYSLLKDFTDFDTKKKKFQINVHRIKSLEY